MVTGASGFLGGHVVPLLVAHGWKVSALARSDQAARAVAALGAKAIEGDLDRPESIIEAFQRAGGTVLVNLASLGFGHAQPIVTAAERAGLRRAVFVSTTAIFTSLNAASKTGRLEAERCIQESGLDWTILRPTMIYGTDRDRNMWRLLELVRRSPLIPVPGGGNRLQQPVHVADLAEAIVACVDVPAAVGRAYDIAGPEAITFRRVVKEAAAGLGRKAVVVPVPAAPLLAVLRRLESSGRRAPLKAEQVERMLEDKVFDIGPAQRDLGYRPRSFLAGITAEAGRE